MNRRADDGLADLVDAGRIGQLRGLSISPTVPSRAFTWYTTVGAVVMSSMSYSRSSRLLDDVHVQEPQEAAPEAEAQRLARSRARSEGSNRSAAASAAHRAAPRTGSTPTG